MLEDQRGMNQSHGLFVNGLILQIDPMQCNWEPRVATANRLQVSELDIDPDNASRGAKIDAVQSVAAGDA